MIEMNADQEWLRKKAEQEDGHFVSVGSEYLCQFCGRVSPVSEWKRLQDKCPVCGKEYAAFLAQDEDECVA